MKPLAELLPMDPIADCCMKCARLLAATQRSGGYQETTYACRERCDMWTVEDEKERGECPDYVHGERDA